MPLRPEVAHRLADTLCAVAADPGHKRGINVIIQHHHRDIEALDVLNEHRVRLESEEHAALVITAGHDGIVAAGFQLLVVYRNDIHAYSLLSRRSLYSQDYLISELIYLVVVYASIDEHDEIAGIRRASGLYLVAHFACAAKNALPGLFADVGGSRKSLRHRAFRHSQTVGYILDSYILSCHAFFLLNPLLRRLLRLLRNTSALR